MRYLFFCFVLFQGITLAIAQPSAKHGHGSKKNPEQKADAQLAKLSQEVSLTPEQTQQIKAIYIECDQQLDSLNRQVKAVRQKKKAGLKQVLTPEQYKTYMESQNKRLRSGKQTGTSADD